MQRLREYFPGRCFSVHNKRKAAWIMPRHCVSVVENPYGTGVMIMIAGGVSVGLASMIIGPEEVPSGAGVDWELEGSMLLSMSAP